MKKVLLLFVAILSVSFASYGQTVQVYPKCLIKADGSVELSQSEILFSKSDLKAFADRRYDCAGFSMDELMNIVIFISLNTPWSQSLSEYKQPTKRVGLKSYKWEHSSMGLRARLKCCYKDYYWNLSVSITIAEKGENYSIAFSDFKAQYAENILGPYVSASKPIYNKKGKVKSKLMLEATNELLDDWLGIIVSGFYGLPVTGQHTLEDSQIEAFKQYYMYRQF